MKISFTYSNTYWGHVEHLGASWMAIKAKPFRCTETKIGPFHCMASFRSGNRIYRASIFKLKRAGSILTLFI